MFGNLVQIELIRLFKSKALKISAAIGAFLLIFMMTIIDYLVYLGALFFINNGDMSAPMFEISSFMLFYSMITALIAPVTVIYTTCGYQKARLSVNIEGAIRSRLKLCLSDLTGIALFVLILNLLVIPGVGLLCLVYRNEMNPISLITDLNTIYVFMSAFLSNMYGCLIAYLVSKFTSNSVLSMSVTMLYSVVSYVVIILLAGFVSGKKGSGLLIPNNLQELLFYVAFMIPVVALSIALAVRYKKADRI